MGEQGNTELSEEIQRIKLRLQEKAADEAERDSKFSRRHKLLELKERREDRAVRRLELAGTSGRGVQFTSAQATVAAAALAVLSAALGGWIHATMTKDVERLRAQATIDLEKQKQDTAERIAQNEFETTLILKAIEAPSRETQIRNLKFFLNAGFISDREGKIAAMDEAEFPSLPQVPSSFQPAEITGSNPGWNVAMVRAAEAMELLPRNTTGNFDWGDICVAHLDTGYTEHPIFGQESGGSAVKYDHELNLMEPGKPALDPLDYDRHPGHGTRMLSVLTGGFVDDQWTQSESVSDERRKVPVGVMPGLPVTPIRVVNSVVLAIEAHRTRIVEAIRHVLDNTSCGVIAIGPGDPSMMPGQTGDMGDAVDEAYERGTIIVAPGGQIIDRVMYPANYNRTIGVGGVTAQGRQWWDYRFGREAIDVLAPAENILHAEAGPRPPSETSPTNSERYESSLDSASNSGNYSFGNGTSYAAMHVAAAAAMWLRLRKFEIEVAYVEPWQRVEAFRRLLKSTSVKLVSSRNPDESGILDIRSLLESPLPSVGELKKAL